MTVHRLTPLPVGAARGRLVVGQEVVERTLAHLAAEGDRSPLPHEGLVWWFGRRVDDDAYVMSCIAPKVDSGPQHVFADEAALGEAAAIARAHRLTLVAQVHSHPGGDTRHSDGDDELVVMPFEAMFSVVVGTYGADDIRPAHGSGLHQFQDGRWVWITDGDASLIVVPPQLDA
jgi:proteasome lid subunit RPN8/RPN11